MRLPPPGHDAAALRRRETILVDPARKPQVAPCAQVQHAQGITLPGDDVAHHKEVLRGPTRAIDAVHGRCADSPDPPALVKPEAIPVNEDKPAPVGAERTLHGRAL